jgi:TolA-binding protein
VESIRLSMKKLVLHLNEFDTEVRSQMAILEQRLNNLERNLEHLEGGQERLQIFYNATTNQLKAGSDK